MRFMIIDTCDLLVIFACNYTGYVNVKTKEH